MKSHKKSIIIAVLCVACVGVLVICLILGRDKTPEFVPDPAPQNTPSGWEESHSGSDGGGSSDYVKPDTADDEYPKETQDADGNVAVEFTPSGDDLKPEPPEPPKTDADYTDPAAPPTYTPEKVAPPPAETTPPSPDTPAPGSTNESGAVYDPVFGWIVPGQVNQTPIDSEGDPDKMVGEMGP